MVSGNFRDNPSWFEKTLLVFLWVRCLPELWSVQIVTTLSLSCTCGKRTDDIRLTLPEIDRFKKAWAIFHDQPGCRMSAAVEFKKPKQEKPQ
jgi:hypothetical protein